MEGSFQHNPATTTGLTFGMRTGNYNTNDNDTVFTNPTVTLLDDTVNSVFIDAGADGTTTPVLKAQLQGSEDAADLRQILFTVTTVSGVITNIVDRRTGALTPFLSSAGGSTATTKTGVDNTVYANHLFNYYRPDVYYPCNEASGDTMFDQASGAHGVYPKPSSLVFQAAGPSDNLPHAFESTLDEWAGGVLPFRMPRTISTAQSNVNMGGIVAFWVYWPTQTETEDSFLINWRQNDPDITSGFILSSYDQSADTLVFTSRLFGESIVTFTSDTGIRADVMPFDQWHMIWWDFQILRYSVQVNGKRIKLNQVNTGPEGYGIGKQQKGGFGLDIADEHLNGTQNTDAGMPIKRMCALSIWNKPLSFQSWGSSSAYDLYTVGRNLGQEA